MVQFSMAGHAWLHSTRCAQTFAWPPLNIGAVFLLARILCVHALVQHQIEVCYAGNNHYDLVCSESYMKIATVMQGALVPRFEIIAGPLPQPSGSQPFTRITWLIHFGGP